MATYQYNFSKFFIKCAEFSGLHAMVDKALKHIIITHGISLEHLRAIFTMGLGGTPYDVLSSS